MVCQRMCLAVLAPVLVCLLAGEVLSGSIETSFRIELRRPNVYVGIPIPTRESLRTNSPYWRKSQLRRGLRALSPPDCRSELFHIRMGFAAVYPSAPDISANLGSWGNHVLIKHFPDLYLCRLRHNLQSALSEIDAQSWTFIPIPQRINPITFDFGKFTDAPEPIRSARGHVLDLVWMSYTGYAPAMLELVKVSARDDIIRLTPRFTYYLLRISERARLRDPAIARLLGLVHQHLSADERAEIDRRALSRKWPATERMVID